MTTTDQLLRAARTCGWVHQGITANRGKLHVDYFSRDPWLITVEFDALGRIVSAAQSRRLPGVSLEKHIGPRVPEKLNRIMEWFYA